MHRTLALIALCTSCSAPLVFHCETSAQCDLDDERGTCQPSGYCSFADPACPEGARYVDHAPGELADQCVTYGQLLAHWTFDDKLGGTAADSSGNGYAGDLKNGPVWTTGVTRGALAFDGFDDEIVVPAFTYFGTSSFSAFAWVTSADSEVQARVLGAGFAAGYCYLNFGGGRPEVEAYDSIHSYWGIIANAGTNLADDRWHHIGFVVDREVGETRLYIDGLFQARGSHVSSADFGSTSNPGVFLIAGQDAAPALALQGTLDEVRVYTSAVDDRAIQAMFDADAPR